MRFDRPGILVAGGLAALGLAAIVVWLGIGPGRTLHARIPGMDRPAEATATPSKPLEGTLTTGNGQPADLAGSWPQFRGERLDGIGEPGVALARQWPSEGPPHLWSVDLGEGYAGPAVYQGCVYLLDYDRETSADALRCLSLGDGKEIWRFSYPVDVKRNHGMSRTVPAVTDQYVIALGPKCHVTCLDRVTGQSRWLIDLVRQHGATVPPWYAGQCPLVDNDRLILAPGGPETLMMALDCATGEPVWKTPNPRAWKMTHVSIVPMEIAGRRMYVYCGSGGVAGVAADDGSLLWDTTDWKISIATVPSPVVLPEGKIFFSGGYNSGALLLQVSRAGDRFVTKTLVRLKPDQFGSTQHTPILLGEHLYGIREKDKELVCLDLEGQEVWTSGRQHRFGLGPYLIADGLIYVMSDDGVLTLAEAIPTGYNQLAEHRVFDGHDAWGPMALVGNRLLVRDFTRLACLDVSEKP
ncbi:MAG: PQQ-binding-like beta-propeller repeat protein [Rhodopirellula sp.]|nr:PQQ-binding-like beta-propeller repeat protein [Rhodopirellula sp.]